MAKTVMLAAALAASIGAYADELTERAGSVDNPGGEPLANLQAEIEDRIRREGGENAAAVLEGFKAYARDVHNHKVTAEAARDGIEKWAFDYERRTTDAANAKATAVGNVTPSATPGQARAAARTGARKTTPGAAVPASGVSDVVTGGTGPASSTEAVNRNQPPNR